MDPETIKARYNERVKLLATYINNMAVAAITAGVLGPLAARVYLPNHSPGIVPTAVLISVGFMFTLLSIGLHAFARFLMGQLL